MVVLVLVWVPLLRECDERGRSVGRPVKCPGVTGGVEAADPCCGVDVVVDP